MTKLLFDSSQGTQLAMELFSQIVDKVLASRLLQLPGLICCNLYELLQVVMFVCTATVIFIDKGMIAAGIDRENQPYPTTVHRLLHPKLHYNASDHLCAGSDLTWRSMPSTPTTAHSTPHYIITMPSAPTTAHSTPHYIIPSLCWVRRDLGVNAIHPYNCSPNTILHHTISVLGLM